MTTYLKNKSTGELINPRSMDCSLSPSDFGHATWDDVFAASREVDMIDGWEVIEHTGGTKPMSYGEIRSATLDRLNDELAAAGWDSTQTGIYEARDAVARLICETQGLTLHDYRSGDVIRPATDDEAAESIDAGEEGVIDVDGRHCYVA